MFSDELTNKALSVSFKSSKITIKVLRKIIKALLTDPTDYKNQPIQGLQSLKQLNRQNQALQDIPISNQDLKQFKSELKSYGVDYAIRKNLAEPDTYKIYFKGKDVGQIENALKNYMARQFKDENKPSIKERIKQAVEKYSSQKDQLQSDKSKCMSREEPQL